MYTNTKYMILEYLEKETGKLHRKNLDHFTANFISKQFVVSRSLVSHYLNELYKEGMLIKVNERPVLYLYKQLIQSQFSDRTLRNEYDSIDEFEQIMHTGISTFAKVIGSDYSLRNGLVNIKKALHYPAYGLPIVLSGKPGSGKKFISYCIYEYCINQKLINDHSKYILISCDTMTTENLDSYLFSEQGVLKEGNVEFVVLNNINAVEKNIQEKIVKYMDEHLLVRFIFICSKWEEGKITSSLRSRLLNIIQIPSLKERTIHEKESLILHFVRTEAKKVKREIFISDYFMELMVAYDFDNDIENLNNIVIKSFANAYQNGKESIYLDLSCIPSELKTNVSFFEKEKKFLIDEYTLKYHHLTREMFDSILTSAENYYLHSNGGKELYAAVEKFNDYVIFKLPKFQANINQYVTIVNNLAELAESRFRVNLSTNVKHLITHCLYCQSVEFKILHDFLEENKDRIARILEILSGIEELEFQVVEETQIMLDKTFSIELNGFLKLIMILNLKFDNINVSSDHAIGILICHGYSTASSIANAANTLLGEQIFVAFDMPLDVKLEQIVDKIDTFLSEKHFLNDVIILVDMGSLEQIGNMIKNKADINLGIINNITTAMAIEVGYEILQKKNTEQILKNASEKIVCKYSFFQKKVKEKAIVFTSESGMSIAERIKGLFEDSIPKTIPIQLLSYDYYHILQDETRNELLPNCDVIFIAGTMDPKIEGITFINLSEIIDLSAINQIQKIFNNYMTTTEIQRFTDDLIKNFSLTNVIESLTILNPKPLLNIVEKSVHKLEREQSSQIHPKILIGLYVHICCFVERMVKHDPIKTYPNIDEFEENQKLFIKDVRTTFTELINHYGIEIPVSEIGYIYDYIHSMKAEEKVDYHDE